MASKGKKYRESLKEFDKTQLYTPDEALNLIKKISKAKFDETVEISVRLGIDPKRSDQTVRGTVVLPFGTGKTPRVIVFAKADKVKEAEEAGAIEAGADDLIEKVKGGWMDFDLAVATPDMMASLGKNLGKVLGPRMPNPKAGTVTPDIKKTVKELLSGKIQFRADKLGIVHSPLGKVSFDFNNLSQNFATFMDALVRAKPATAKGTYLKTVVLSSTMGPGIKLDPQKCLTAGK